MDRYHEFDEIEHDRLAANQKLFPVECTARDFPEPGDNAKDDAQREVRNFPLQVFAVKRTPLVPVEKKQYEGQEDDGHFREQCAEVPEQCEETIASMPVRMKLQVGMQRQQEEKCREPV